MGYMLIGAACQPDREQLPLHAPTISASGGSP